MELDLVDFLKVYSGFSDIYPTSIWLFEADFIGSCMISNDKALTEFPMTYL